MESNTIEARQIFRSALHYALASVSKKDQAQIFAVDTFTKQINSSSQNTLNQLVEISVKNRFTLPLKQILAEESFARSRSTGAKSLDDLLNHKLNETQELESKRDLVIKRLSELLLQSSIEHLFFKTFNPFGGVGVDVDLLIRKEDFPKSVSAIMRNGFTPIDSLSKTYATGFLLEGGENPIIVDLHTDIAILGVSYLSPEILFANKIEVEIEFDFGRGSETCKLNVVNEKTAALVTIAHSIIKESSVRASNLLEVYQAYRLYGEVFSDFVKSEHLQVAYELFMLVMQYELSDTEFSDDIESLSTPIESFPTLASKLAVSFLAKSLRKDNAMPAKIPVESSAIAFFDDVRRRGELGQALPKAISSFKFGRNVARAGQKLMAPFRD
jgi:hypothetical protein